MLVSQALRVYLLLHDSGTAVAALSGRNEPISTHYGLAAYTPHGLCIPLSSLKSLRAESNSSAGMVKWQVNYMSGGGLASFPGPCPAHSQPPAQPYSQAPALLFTACSATDEKQGRGLGTRLYQDPSPLPYNRRRVWLVPGWSVGGALLSRVARMW